MCKPLKELRNWFPAWRAGTTTLFDVGYIGWRNRFLGIGSWAPLMVFGLWSRRNRIRTPWLKGTVYDIFTSGFLFITPPYSPCCHFEVFARVVDVVTTMLPVPLDTVDILVVVPSTKGLLLLVPSCCIIPSPPPHSGIPLPSFRNILRFHEFFSHGPALPVKGTQDWDFFLASILKFVLFLY